MLINSDNRQKPRKSWRGKAMHECPDCYKLCHCRGDIDSINFGADMGCLCDCESCDDEDVFDYMDLSDEEIEEMEEMGL